jgi:hypothetical protein
LEKYKISRDTGFLKTVRILHCNTVSPKRLMQRSAAIENTKEELVQGKNKCTGKYASTMNWKGRR